MKESPLLNSIRNARGDISPYLFHFTRKLIPAKSIFKSDSPPESYPTAKERLIKILRDRYLKGSDGFIKGQHKCVCFTESPVGELRNLFQVLKNDYANTKKARYEPYGLAFDKRWIFEQGGLPVIYQPEKLYKNLPADLNHRHVTFDLAKGTDYTWEREWRIATTRFDIHFMNAIVIVPTQEEANEITHMFSESEYSDVKDGIPINPTDVPTWNAVPIDDFC